MIDEQISFYAKLRADLSVLTVRNTGPLTMLACLLSRPGFLAVFLYRLANACVHQGLLGKVLASFFSRLNSFINACNISPKAEIGPGFKLPHPMGVVIGLSVIGHNVMILQNAVLGLRRFTDDEADPRNYPTIGDDVTIGAGAAILGGVKVGNRARVGANAVVLKDVPENTTAVGTPAHVTRPAINQSSHT